MTWDKAKAAERSAYNAKWRAENPTTQENWAQRNLPFIRYRAKRKGIPFDLRAQDVYVPANCPVLGVKLTFGAARNNFSSPSLDRIIPSLGYVKGNVAVISLRANVIKSDGSALELRQVANWLEAQNVG